MVSFRQYKTSSGKVVLLGKSAETNEALVNQVENREILLHTNAPGSPFTNIKSDEEDLSKEDLYESAVMCAKHSQDWRDNKRDVNIHAFSKTDVFKTKDMPLGTFGVKKFKEIKVKKQDILEFEKGIKN